MSLTIGSIDSIVDMGIGDANEWADVENQLAALLPGVDNDSLNSAIQQYVAANPTATSAEVLEAVVTQLNPDVTSEEVAALRSEWEEFAQTSDLDASGLLAIMGVDSTEAISSSSSTSAMDLMVMCLLMIINLVGEEAAYEMLEGFKERDTLMELAMQKAGELQTKAAVSFACSVTSAGVSVVGGCVSLGMTLGTPTSSSSEVDAPDAAPTGTGGTTPTTTPTSQAPVDTPDDLAPDTVAPKPAPQQPTGVDAKTQVDLDEGAPDTQAPKTTAPETTKPGTTGTTDAPDDAPDTQAPKTTAPETTKPGTTETTDAPDDAPDAKAPKTTEGKTSGTEGADADKGASANQAKTTKIQTLVMAMNQLTQGTAGAFSSGGQLAAGLMDAQIALTDGETSVTQAKLSHHQEMQQMAQDLASTMLEVINNSTSQKYSTLQQISQA